MLTQPRIESQSSKATATTVWKTPVCKRDVCKRGVLKCPVSHVLNFRGWIKLIYDKITSMYSVKNEFNQTSEVQNIGNGAFQNAPFANGDYSCLWATSLSFIMISYLAFSVQTNEVRVNICHLLEQNKLWSFSTNSHKLSQTLYRSCF